MSTQKQFGFKQRITLNVRSEKCIVLKFPAIGQYGLDFRSVAIA